MNFHSPHLLWLLVPLLLLFSWELARRAGAAGTTLPKVLRAWAGAFVVSLGAKHTTAESRPRLWLWFGLALCIIALARPQWGVIEERVFDQSREVLIAVDLSRSMLADDVKPNRLERAKLLITSLLDRLRGERVGLVLFAGTSFLQVPLSADYEIFREFLPALNPNYLPEGGSNYRAMLETAIEAFGTSAADRYLIILSDGESTDETWKHLGDSAKNKGIRVIGLGIGTTQGAFIPDGSGGLVKDERGAVVLSRLNSATLQDLAQLTGGAYTDASAWVDLPDLLSHTVEAGQKGEFSESNTARLVERYQWFLAPGVLLLLISFWAEFPVRPRERALPLGSTARRAQRGGRSARSSGATIASLAAVAWLSAFNAQGSATAAETGDTFAKPLTSTVARLAEKPNVSAKEFAELAQATITFGERTKGTPQKAPGGVIRDGLAAVDAGEALDTNAADWSRLRRELEQLLPKDEPPPEEEPKQDEQQKQDQQQQQKQQNDSQPNEENQDQQQSQDQQKQDQQPSDEQQNQQQKQQQDAFGDMNEQKDPPPPNEQPEEPRPPEPQTQKVGGQKDRKEQPADPELAMPLQKLEQVRDLDSPARLQLLMQGQQPKQTKKGKDW